MRECVLIYTNKSFQLQAEDDTSDRSVTNSFSIGKGSIDKIRKLCQLPDDTKCCDAGGGTNCVSLIDAVKR